MNSPFSLESKIIFVTGASSGIGRQICISASEAGATIIATGRDENRLAETLSLLKGENHKIIPFDLTSLHLHKEFVDIIPKISGIIHAAGMARYIPFKAISEKEIRQTQLLNYESPILLTQQLLKNKKIEKSGSIVFIASISGLIGTVGNTIYAGSKAALIGATRALALEVSGQGIRANCISPGMVMTPLTAKIEDSVSSDTFRENEKLHPLGFGKPEDVANASIFLLSDASRWITGTNLVIDGGYTCH
jgi:NAD(P)-dependent dehydrogenase (short-subunit alcohol dehydrogenase family)